MLCGGTSSERAVSLKSGEKALAALDPSRYDVTRYDPAHDLPRLVADAPSLDVALLVLHGPRGEDGTVQGLLDLLGVPYQGSGVLGSALAMNKQAAKILYQAAGIPVPSYAALTRKTPPDFDRIVEDVGLPLVVKPCQGGSSIGMSLVRAADQLPAATALALEQDTEALAEAYVSGTEITCGVLGNDDLMPLPLVEIVPEGGSSFFDYTAKYQVGGATEICPARMDDKITARAQALGVAAHRALFCRGYSRTDMIVSGNDIYVLETNTIPGMAQTSLLPLAAAAAGLPFSALLDRLIELALEDRRAAAKV
ncbi:MAG: D-alanine--D-alanine ligase [Pseudomonadota bacterium]